MAKLNLGIEVRDFDLERMGFSLSVLDQSGKRQTSEGYLRMTLRELGIFADALKAARDDISVRAFDDGLNRHASELSPSRSIAAE
jgi:hypothetical protein